MIKYLFENINNNQQLLGILLIEITNKIYQLKQISLNKKCTHGTHHLRLFESYSFISAHFFYTLLYTCILRISLNPCTLGIRIQSKFVLVCAEKKFDCSGNISCQYHLLMCIYYAFLNAVVRISLDHLALSPCVELSPFLSNNDNNYNFSEQGLWFRFLLQEKIVDLGQILTVIN